MPTYEFRCPQGHEFEKFYRTISGGEAHAACPECGQPSERMMSAAGFAFKGSGFYLTDYGRNAHRDKGTPTPASPADHSDSGKSESGKSESGKSESGKSESGKSESGKSDGGKSESSSSEASSSGSKSDSARSDASSGGASSGAGDSARKAAVSDAKPAPAPAKKSTGE